MAALAAVKRWCISAAMYDRQRTHRWHELTSVPEAPEALLELEALKLSPAPSAILTDATRDSMETGRPLRHSLKTCDPAKYSRYRHMSDNELHSLFAVTAQAPMAQQAEADGPTTTLSDGAGRKPKRKTPRKAVQPAAATGEAKAAKRQRSKRPKAAKAAKPPRPKRPKVAKQPKQRRPKAAPKEGVEAAEAGGSSDDSHITPCRVSTHRSWRPERLRPPRHGLRKHANIRGLTDDPMRT